MNNTPNLGEEVIASAITSFRANKDWADRAIAQLPDERLHVALDENTNNVAVIMKHIAAKPEISLDRFSHD